MAENVHDVAAFLLARLGPLDTWRLQKLLYYSQAWHLALHGEPLFDRDVQAWKDGPVVREIYEEHRSSYRVVKWPLGRPKRLGSQAVAVISRVVEQYGEFSGAELSRFTHAEAPWRLTRAGLSPGAPSSAVIDRELMGGYYARQVLTPEEAVEAAVESARIEGHEFDAVAVARMAEVAEGRRSVDDAVAEVVARYRGRD